MKELAVKDVLMLDEERQKLIDLWNEFVKVRKEELKKCDKVHIELQRMKNKRLKVTIRGKKLDSDGIEVIGNMVIGKTKAEVFW